MVRCRWLPPSAKDATVDTAPQMDASQAERGQPHGRPVQGSHRRLLPNVLSPKDGHYLRWTLPEESWTLDQPTNLEARTTGSSLATSNLHRPYGFGRNGAGFGVAPSRNEEHWLGVAPPNPTPLRSEI